MAALARAHTCDLDPVVAAQLRPLLNAVFVDDFSDDDYDHAMGGMHILATIDGRLVGHASVVQRQLICDGTTYRVGYVEAVAVHPDARRRGIGQAMMESANEVIERAYDFGALGATDEAIEMYEKAGWRRWRGHLQGLTPDGPVSCADEEGWVLVYTPTVALDVDTGLTCDWRIGDLW